MEGNMKRLASALVILLAGLALPYLLPGEPRPALAVRPLESLTIKNEIRPLTAAEAKKIEAHLRRTLGMPAIRLVMQSVDADVMIGDKILGIVYPDEDGGERTFYFEMAIFGSDLDGNASTESKR
jgi:hypothetical protein